MAEANQGLLPDPEVGSVPAVVPEVGWLYCLGLCHGTLTITKLASDVRSKRELATWSHPLQGGREADPFCVPRSRKI